MAQTGKVYFKGFNALRFYAALSVLIQHISYNPHDWFGVPLLPVTLERFFLNGSDAVNLFFILSGFLITYLLLTEQHRTGKVNMRNFYVRRVLRIFPVYFVYLAVVLLLLHPPYGADLIFLVSFFMGNVAYVLLFPFPPLDHLWSIGVEEQYYLLAPVMARFKNALLFILLLIIAVWWVMAAIVSLQPPTAFTAFVLMSRYDLIAVGGLAAYGYYQQWRWMRFLRHGGVRLLAVLITAAAIVHSVPSLEVVPTTVLGLAFVILIYNMAASPGLPKLLESRLLDFLGNLSYSMYVYHPLFILLFHRLFYDRLSLELYQWIGYPLIIGLTLGTSWFSYQLLETPFLRLKHRFQDRHPVEPPYSEDAAVPVSSQ